MCGHFIFPNEQALSFRFDLRIMIKVSEPKFHEQSLKYEKSRNLQNSILYNLRSGSPASLFVLEATLSPKKETLSQVTFYWKQWMAKS